MGAQFWKAAPNIIDTRIIETKNAAFFNEPLTGIFSSVA